MAELLKNIIENSVRIPTGGFYVTRMKRDPATGHYIGVATWIPKNQPLPGSRIVPEISIQPPNHLIPDRVEERNPLPPSIQESRIEPAQSSVKLSADRKITRTTVFDPYDAYEL